MSNGTEGWTTDDDLDVDNASDAPPPPLENGVYFVTIVAAKPQQVGQGVKEPGINIQCRAEHGFGDAPIGHHSKNLYATQAVTPEKVWKTKQLAKAASVECCRRNNPEALKDFCDSLVGQQMWVLTKKQTYQGKVSAKIDRYLGAEQVEAANRGDNLDDLAAATEQPADASSRRRSRTKAA